jgi:hypothetical protein
MSTLRTPIGWHVAPIVLPLPREVPFADREALSVKGTSSSFTERHADEVSDNGSPFVPDARSVVWQPGARQMTANRRFGAGAVRTLPSFVPGMFFAG